MYLVTLINQGTQFWLRGTTWAFSVDRASRFATVEDAQVALHIAKQFMKAKTFKLAQIIETPKC